MGCRDGVALRNAGLLDTPSIFELMMEGSVSGAFSDNFLMRIGTPRLVWFILAGLVGQCWRVASRGHQAGWQLIVDTHQVEIGILKTSE